MPFLAPSGRCGTLRDAMPHSSESSEVRLGPQGRLVIPAALRRALAFEPGQVLVARAEGDRLVLEKREVVLARLRGRFSVVPAEVSLSDELIAERRLAAQTEEP